MTKHGVDNLVVAGPLNYTTPASTYPWDYWPADESRSECGYVGLTNLGATCYMASCMQHLYMMPQARAAVLRADPAQSRHASTIAEMQRMFAYLMVSVTIQPRRRLLHGVLQAAPLRSDHFSIQ